MYLAAYSNASMSLTSSPKFLREYSIKILKKKLKTTIYQYY